MAVNGKYKTFIFLIILGCLSIGLFVMYNGNVNIIQMMAKTAYIGGADEASLLTLDIRGGQVSTVLGTGKPSNLSQKSDSSSNDIVIDLDQLNRKQLPILSIFTSFKNDPARFNIHSNVLHNWAIFKPNVIPVLFDSNTDPKLVALAKQLGWKVLQLSAKNTYGTPYLREMYMDCKKNFDSTFYGWSNGDLLFDEGLVKTLDVLKSILDKMKKTLVVGRRYNFPIKDRTLYKPADVTATAKKEGKLFSTDAEDYFFIAHNDFPWDKIPRIVIGRPAYDNYLVATAVSRGISVVDATKTLLALHQSGKDGNYAGHSSKNKDVYYNRKMIGKFSYQFGHTSNAQFETVYNTANKVEVWQRASKTRKKVQLSVPEPTAPKPKSTPKPSTPTLTKKVGLASNQTIEEIKLKSAQLLDLMKFQNLSSQQIPDVVSNLKKHLDNLKIPNGR